MISEIEQFEKDWKVEVINSAINYIPTGCKQNRFRRYVSIRNQSNHLTDEWLKLNPTANPYSLADLMNELNRLSKDIPLPRVLLTTIVSFSDSSYPFNNAMLFQPGVPHFRGIEVR